MNKPDNITKLKTYRRKKISSIAKTIEDHYHLKLTDKCRKTIFVEAKRVFCYVARQNKYTYQQIGDFMNVHHSNSLHHYKEAEKKISKGNFDFIFTLDKLFLLNVADKHTKHKTYSDHSELFNMFLPTLKDIPAEKRNDVLDRVKLLIKSYEWKSKDSVKVYETSETMQHYCW